MTIYLYALICMWSFKKYACSQTCTINYFTFVFPVIIYKYYICIQWHLCSSYTCAIAILYN